MEKFTYLSYAEVNPVAKDNLRATEKKVAILKLFKLIIRLISINWLYFESLTEVGVDN